ncbi:hypothetical protein [Micromonospora sp. WMMD980]|uniref:hypothetical protein n=1 Tax=Micromonospora sp. WMMD980 TaxID=3016088 RepID=UPI002416B1E3|nr:hypothetical protein [Micromonospora sp. WMMD980]MDG4801714.1 hypothetical protein [Micromonospora sp. WMMD980]
MPEHENEPQNTNAGNGEGGTGTTPPAPADKAPKWEGEYDPEKAARLVANLRAELDGVKGKLKTREDAEKSELQRAIERAEAAEAEAGKLRTASAITEAVKAHGLPAQLAKYVTGATEDEINASAKALAEDFGVKAEQTTEPIPGRPKPRLVPGHATSGDEGFDPNAVIKAVRGTY